VAILRLALLIPLMASLSSWLGDEVFRAIRTGVGNAGGTPVSVRKQPWAFWLMIAVQLGFATVCGLMLLDVLHEALSNV
jgi:hypothetical protein